MLNAESLRYRTWIVIGIAVGLVCAFAACAPAPGDAASNATSAPAKPDAAAMAQMEESVINAHKGMIAAFESGDASAFVAHMDPSSDLLIFHPFLENRFDGIEEIQTNLPRMLSRLTGASWADIHPAVHVSGDVAWVTSHVMLKADGMKAPFIGRGTEIWVRRDGAWRLTHGHWSEHAELAGNTE